MSFLMIALLPIGNTQITKRNMLMPTIWDTIVSTLGYKSYG
jgi:hypothetical protein